MHATKSLLYGDICVIKWQGILKNKKEGSSEMSAGLPARTTTRETLCIFEISPAVFSFLVEKGVSGGGVSLLSDLAVLLKLRYI